MLIVRELIDAPSEYSVSVAQTSSGWTLSGGLPEKPSWTFVFSPDQASQSPDVGLLVVGRKGETSLVWLSELSNDRVAHAHAMGRVNVSSIAPVAAFVVTSTGECHCFVSAAETYAGDLSCVVDTSAGIQSEVLKTHIPEIVDYFNRVDAKNELLAQVRTTDSLAALEAQVDLLSVLVIDLLAQVPESDHPAWLPAFSDMVSGQSCVQFKGPDGALLDVLKHKTGMRELQRRYFARRDGAGTQ